MTCSKVAMFLIQTRTGYLGRLEILLDISKALSYMHGLRYIHRDIKVKLRLRVSSVTCNDEGRPVFILYVSDLYSIAA